LSDKQRGISFAKPSTPVNVSESLDRVFEILARLDARRAARQTAPVDE
jgi:hypothetical protein